MRIVSYLTVASVGLSKIPPSPHSELIGRAVWWGEPRQNDQMSEDANAPSETALRAIAQVWSALALCLTAHHQCATAAMHARVDQQERSGDHVSCGNPVDFGPVQPRRMDDPDHGHCRCGCGEAARIHETPVALPLGVDRTWGWSSVIWPVLS